MILLSIHKLEIGKYNKNICNKLIHVKKIKNITYGKLNETINSTINNLKLLDEYITIFDSFIAKTIIDRGFDIVSGGTKNHLMLVSLVKQGLTGKAADAALHKANITVNKNSVPNDPQRAITVS